MKLLFITFVTLFLVLNTSAKTLPKYIKKCSITKNFNKCFVKNANEAIPYLLNGDKDYNLPSFNPLKLDEIQFNPTDSLQIVFTNISASGFAEAKVLSGNYDKIMNEFTYQLIIPHFDVKSNYKAKGNILILPFQGQGTAHIQLHNLIYTNTFKLNASNIKSHKFLTLKKSIVDYTVDKTIYQFNNLFHGNEDLGKQLNIFLNENEAELDKDFKPVFKETINIVTKTIINGVLEKMRFSDVFDP